MTVDFCDELHMGSIILVSMKHVSTSDPVVCLGSEWSFERARAVENLWPHRTREQYTISYPDPDSTSE